MFHVKHILETLERRVALEQIVTLISNVGFPIAVSLVLMWQLKNTTDTHKEETKEFTEALNKNTLVLQSLSEKLDEVLRK